MRTRKIKPPATVSKVKDCPNCKKPLTWHASRMTIVRDGREEVRFWHTSCDCGIEMEFWPEEVA